MGVDWPLFVAFLGGVTAMTLFLQGLRVVLRRLSGKRRLHIRRA
jgi:hypothetical protein